MGKHGIHGVAASLAQQTMSWYAVPNSDSTITISKPREELYAYDPCIWRQRQEDLEFKASLDSVSKRVIKHM